MPKMVLVADAPWVVNEVKSALAAEPWQYVEVSDPRQVTAVVGQELPDARFVTPEGDVWGRPVGVTVAKDGALLVSDDSGDCIWRVAYEGGKKE